MHACEHEHKHACMCVYLCDISICMCICTYVCSIFVILISHDFSAAVERDAAANHIMELEKELADLKTKLSKVIFD